MSIKSLKQIAVACVCSLGAALCISTITVGQQKSDTKLPAQARPLTPSERRGRIIYLRGETANKREMTAKVGDLDVPATALTCAGCHGRTGEGKTESGVTAGNLTWANLTKSYGHTHADGRKHGQFTESSFTTAIVRGFDPAGNKLAAAMPRYGMSTEELNDLIAYIKCMELDRDPGLTSESIDVGVPLSATNALAEISQAIREVLSAYFEDLNASGGIHKRKIRLHFTGPDTTDMLASLRTLVSQNQVFAFIGGISAGADKEIGLLARENEVPFIGPATLLPQDEHLPNRYVFYLLPGVGEQAIALANFADQHLGLKKQRAAILFSTAELPAAAAEAAIARMQQAGWNEVSKMPYSAASFDATRLAQQLKTDGIAAVFIFGAGNDIENFVRAANTLEWSPQVFSLGLFVSKNLAANLAPSLTKKVFLAFPTVPGDVTTDGAAEYRSLSEKYKLTPRHTAAQLATLAAAKTFVEGLKRVGPDLSREQLVTALESLSNYDTGLTPKLIFGPHRRVGAAGAYVLTIDAETKQFVPLSGWVPSN